MHWCEDLKLVEDEEKIVDCSKNEVEDFRARTAWAVVGRLMMDKPFRVFGFFAFLC